MSPIAPGLVIAQRYRLDHELGAGGMGSVWAAEHLELGSPVAIKLLHAGMNDPAMHQRFVAEAKAAAGLRSPHVVQILDHGFDHGMPFIVMEKLDGQSLGERLRDHGRLAFAETLTILTHVARAMTRAHEAGIVHRDMKPDNVFLHRNDDEFVAKVLDFGIAKIQSDALTSVSPNTQTGMLLGSPFFMSPEQAEGRRDVDWRTDLWALGVIVYECLTGHNPYTEETLGRILVKIIKEDVPPPSTLAPVPVGFDAWFARANRKDKEQRFQSAKEMTEALRQLLGQSLVSSLPSAAGASNDGGPPAGTTTMGVAANSMADKLPTTSSGGRYLLFGAAALAVLASGGWFLTRGGVAEKPVEAEPSPNVAAAERAPAAGVASVPAPAEAPAVVEQPQVAAPVPAPSQSAAPTPPAAVGVGVGVAKRSGAPVAAAAKPGKSSSATPNAQPAASPPPTAPAAPAAPFNPLQQRF